MILLLIAKSINSMWFFKNKNKGTSGDEPVLSKEMLAMRAIKKIEPLNPSFKRTSPDSQTMQRVNSPLGFDNKAMAMAAAARIDTIEQEMALDLRGKNAQQLAIHPRANALANKIGIARVAPPPGLKVAIQPQIKKVIDQALPADQFFTMPLGDTNLAALIDVKTAHMAPTVEECAVLFANGQIELATQHLSTAIKQKNGLHQSEFNAYRMLFDLLRLKGDKKAFENYAIDFAVQFEKSPPSWRVETLDIPTLVSSVPTLDLGDILDGSIATALEQLKVLAINHKHMRLDASNIAQINYTDGFGCELLLRVLKAFEGSAYQLDIVGMSHLFTKLRPLIQAKHQRISGHVWLLYLELIRQQNQPLLFDDISLKFAIVYEQSPPQWTAPSTVATLGDTLVNSHAISFDRPDHIKLKGEIVGDGSMLIDLLAQGMQHNHTVLCDCRQLNRIGFEAAGRLLTALTAWTGESKTVEFRNLSHPIAALFVVLGIQHLAVVERRRDD